MPYLNGKFLSTEAYFKIKFKDSPLKLEKKMKYIKLKNHAKKEQKIRAKKWVETKKRTKQIKLEKEKKRLQTIDHRFKLSKIRRICPTCKITFIPTKRKQIFHCRLCYFRYQKHRKKPRDPITNKILKNTLIKTRRKNKGNKSSAGI